VVVLARVLAGVAGAVIVLLTLGAAVRTVVLPRGVASTLTRTVFSAMRAVFVVRAGRAPSYERRDRVFAGYAPVSLLALLMTWLVLSYLGFAGLAWACGARTWRGALALSGSSLFTLGTTVPHGAPLSALTYSEAAIGLALLALLITYLPSLYNAFSRRETLVSKLEVRAGDPPSGAEMVWRAFAIQRPSVLMEAFRSWEDWFIDVEESHTSFSALIFFRSPLPSHSWVTAAGAVLDGAGLFASVIDFSRLTDEEALPLAVAPSADGLGGLRAGDAEVRRPAEPQLLVRAGSLALRRIALFLGMAVPLEVSRDDPISVTRAEWDVAVERIVSSGAPVRPDRDAAWLDFAGWRVNYDQALVLLAARTMAPYAPWSSDRSLAGVSPPRLPQRVAARARSRTGR
jgi:hypothetical protein